MGLASVLLVLSPFTQINTPYPSTAYLKGYLEAKGVRAGSNVDNIGLLADISFKAAEVEVPMWRSLPVLLSGW